MTNPLQVQFQLLSDARPFWPTELFLHDSRSFFCLPAASRERMGESVPDVRSLVFPTEILEYSLYARPLMLLKDLHTRSTTQIHIL